ncbi:hypothetical protein [Paenibacillus sp. PCH8]|uniref:hypothetical protein n=1 Tax=Paenibacillus sp. PCH8 TaxID=2066524 RepID=UPI002157C3B4|nr:hypothetical protein [Paenibacillus sp. PCH8]
MIRWLDKIGLSVPEPEVLKVSLGYSTRYYKIKSSIPNELVMSDSDPEQGIRASIFMRTEDDIAGLILFNAGGEAYPSTQPEEFQEQIKHLFASDNIEKLMEQLEPLQGPRGTAFPSLFASILNLWKIGLLDYSFLAMHFAALIPFMDKVSPLLQSKQKR